MTDSTMKTFVESLPPAPGPGEVRICGVAPDEYAWNYRTRPGCQPLAPLRKAFPDSPAGWRDFVRCIEAEHARVRELVRSTEGDRNARKASGVTYSDMRNLGKLLKWAAGRFRAAQLAQTAAQSARLASWGVPPNRRTRENPTGK